MKYNVVFIEFIIFKFSPKQTLKKLDENNYLN